MCATACLHYVMDASTAVSAARRNAFTLIELVAILAIMALVSATAVVVLRQPWQAANFEHTLHRIALIDHQARTRAQRFGRPMKLTFDLRRGVVRAEDSSEENAKAPLALRLGSHARLISVQSTGRADRRQTTTVDIFSEGQSPTYAVELEGPGESRRWLLFSGITGQLVQYRNEKDARILRNILSSTRNHVD